MKTKWEKHIEKIPEIVAEFKEIPIILDEDGFPIPQIGVRGTRRYSRMYVPLRGEPTEEQRGIIKKFKNTWRNIIYRCTNPHDKRYSYYSKKGVCEAWKNFENFRDDMLLEFTEHVAVHGLKNTTIDRIDNDKGYSKENCRWLTWEANRANSKHKKLPRVDVMCPCGVSFQKRETSKQKYCAILCPEKVALARRSTTPEERRARINELNRARYKNNPVYKANHTRLMKLQYLRKKDTPAYKAKQRQYSMTWANKNRDKISERGKQKWQEIKNDPIKYQKFKDQMNANARKRALKRLRISEI